MSHEQRPKVSRHEEPLRGDTNFASPFFLAGTAYPMERFVVNKKI